MAVPRPGRHELGGRPGGVDGPCNVVVRWSGSGICESGSAWSGNRKVSDDHTWRSGDHRQRVWAPRYRRCGAQAPGRVPDGCLDILRQRKKICP